MLPESRELSLLEEPPAMLKSRFPYLIAATIAAALGHSPAASAQEPEASGGLLDEIVVTAQRREEQIQNVPIAITAFSEAQLERLNVDNTLDLIRLVPNLIGSNNTGLGTANVYSLRALNNTESIASFDPPVGTYVDEVFIARQNANNFSFFDVERVEVLRGPQGTLFGRNTTGGAISLVMRKPSREFGGFTEVGFGQFGAFRVRGTVDLPVSDRLLTKFSVFSQQDDGYVANPITGEDGINATDRFGVRAELRFLPSDTVTWDLAADYMKDEGANMLNFEAEGGPQVELEPLRPGLAPSSAAAANIAANCRGSITRSRYSCTGLRSDQSNLVGFLSGEKQYIPLGNDVRGVSLTSNLGIETRFGALNFITGYRDMKQKFALDFFNNPAPVGGFTIANVGEHKQISQEIKLSGTLGDNISHTSGIYYFDEDNKTDFGDLFWIGFPLVLEDRVLENDARAIALYSQWDFKLNEAFTLTVGGRYTDEKKSVDFISNTNARILTPAFRRVNSDTILTVSPTATVPQLIGPAIPLSQDVGIFTPRVALQYTLNENINFFVSGTRGFKSGGWNARGTAPNEIQPFTEEKVTSYELGMRSDLLDRRLRFNLTLFQFKAEDFQLPSAFVRPDGSIAFITRNFADLKNKGAEAEIILQPTEQLSLFAFIGIQDAEYENLAPEVTAQQGRCLSGLSGVAVPPRTLAQTISDNCSAGIVTPTGGIAKPVRAPDTYTLGGNYEFRIGESLTLTPNVRIQFVGSQAVGSNNSPVSLVDRYSTWNAAVQLANADEGWQLTASCDNCSDRSSIASTLAELPYIQNPRTWAVNFRYNFGDRR
jgi:iron complex outermembrane receptor protein